MSEKSEKFGTETADGWYNHAKLSNGSTTFLAPVKLDFSERFDAGYKPLRRDYKLVYALPGGGEIELPDNGPDA